MTSFIVFCHTKSHHDKCISETHSSLLLLFACVYFFIYIYIYIYNMRFPRACSYMFTYTWPYMSRSYPVYVSCCPPLPPFSQPRTRGQALLRKTRAPTFPKVGPKLALKSRPRAQPQARGPAWLVADIRSDAKWGSIPLGSSAPTHQHAGASGTGASCVEHLNHNYLCIVYFRLYESSSARSCHGGVCSPSTSTPIPIIKIQVQLLSN